ncbi:hypothetical protein [Chitinivorax sp. B]|uniref:hypothetical protein n=1 Tax=Chitinivorax sp. B TaxID=2502235 RepID=UPI0010F93B8E|nr:hypothetical protein [Chitinivorax sp. B]
MDHLDLAYDMVIDYIRLFCTIIRMKPFATAAPGFTRSDNRHLGCQFSGFMIYIQDQVDCIAADCFKKQGRIGLAPSMPGYIVGPIIEPDI